MTSNKQDTRSRLVETAAELLWSRSFHSTGVDEICLRAEAHRGSFYHFFPSKADLAIAVVHETWAHMRQEVFDLNWQAGTSGMDSLHRIVTAIDRFQRKEHERRGFYLGCPFGGLGQEMAHQDERVQRAVDEVLDEHVEYFLQMLEQASEEGEIEPGDLRQRALNILALLEGALLMAKVANSPDRFTAVIRSLPLIAARDRV